MQEDAELFKALERIWNNMASRKLYITGGIGSRAQGEGFGPEYELHNHTAYCETCAAIANVYWNYRMFLATGDARYADVCERALYNGVISGVSLSGDRFFYDNPLESMGQHERAPWFGCACCPGNVTRFMASIPQYVYAVQGDDVYVNMYVNSTSDIKTVGNSVTIAQETRYPWDGKVTFTVTPADEREWALRLRIPGWAAGNPVPSDLYSYTGRAPEPYTVTVNGSKAHVLTGNGYATIKRAWKAGDRVELTLPMEVRRIAAHDSVVDDRGKLAIERGPVIYCLEGPDQADSTVFNKVLPRDVKFGESFDPNLLGGVVTLTAMASEVQPDGSLKDVTVKAIPYSTWNNRGPAQMAVWIPETAGRARAIPSPTIASEAEMYSEPTALNADAPAATSNLQWAWGYNDRWEPVSSADTSKPYHYWWLRHGTEENLCYRFKEPVEVNSVEVYWLDFDHYDGNYRVPERWNLYYKDEAGRWSAVKAKGEFGTAKDRYNRVDFEPVTTTALKLVAKLQDGESGGVIEWKVSR
ncbi:MAG: glycoside hydrolase family 127 protein, partial [Muribaculaceae bacterium]|nr:glycoside hydrolase family 127 protein [Muribaculaceae bacterium]